MIRLRPTRNELVEICVLLVFAVGLLFDLWPKVISRQLLPFIIIAYLAYLAFHLGRWFERRKARRAIGG